MPDDKKKQAMSLLFGDAPARPGRSEAQTPAPALAGEPPPEPVRRKAAPRRAKATAESTSVTPAGVAPQPKRPSRRGRGGELPDSTLTASTPDPYYQGASRYARQAGEQVKHSVYLDPDVSRALKIAAATGDDPRGANVSAIVNEALRGLGYGA